jgi:transcriptional regulator with GAF, ATPase, and Fis domain
MAAWADQSSHDGDQLSFVDDLLAAFAEAPQAADVWPRLARIASRMVFHDEAHLELTPPGSACVYVYGPDGVRQEAESWSRTTVDEPRLLDVVPGADRGLQSGLTVPVLFDDQRVGTLMLLSREPDSYTAADLLKAQRLARCVAFGLAYQKLAGQSREAAAGRRRPAEIEGAIELLRTIADVLDVRTVFSRVSEIANGMLPHDAIAMVFVDQSRRYVHQAKWPADFPDPASVTFSDPQPDEVVYRDVTKGPLPDFEPADAFARIVAAGYRSLLSVKIPVRDRQVLLALWSKQPDAFTEDDVPVARQIADYVALAVSHEQLAEAARQAAEARARTEQLEARVQALSEELGSKLRVVGDSAEWRDVLKKATQVAATDTTVLVTGESGTGKEVIARFIHRASARSRGQFVALNCAALPEQLLESELFGYERGAFTSAQQAKPGQIELAAGGVLFLDEVTEMSLAAQAKFLRVLQEREFQRLGGTRMLKADIRVVAATNRDLRKAVERGDFREDLFYRLKVFDIAIPPLRERAADILPLSEALLQDIGRSFARPPAGLTRDAREALLRYAWPGNVRELRNALERAAILCEGGLIRVEHLALEAVGAPAGAASTDLGTLERDTIAQVLRECRWNRSRAAKRLGLTRTQLYGRIQKYKLEKPADA